MGFATAVLFALLAAMSAAETLFPAHDEVEFEEHVEFEHVELNEDVEFKEEVEFKDAQFTALSTDVELFESKASAVLLLAAAAFAPFLPPLAFFLSFFAPFLAALHASAAAEFAAEAEHAEVSLAASVELELAASVELETAAVEFPRFICADIWASAASICWRSEAILFWLAAHWA